jgi:hypothetical protein
VVLGFLSRQDEDLPDACPPCSGQSVEFRKAPSANSLGRSCLEIAGSNGIWSFTPIFFPTVWFRRERREALLSVAIMIQCSMVKSEAENVMEAKIRRLVVVVGVFAAVKN